MAALGMCAAPLARAPAALADRFTATNSTRS
jgi:hypothetical protein